MPRVILTLTQRQTLHGNSAQNGSFLEKHLRIKATYFENDYEDLVVNATRTYVIDGESVSIKRRVNAESADVNGIETGIEAILPFNLKGGVHYTHHWSKYTRTEGNSKDGWEVAEVPTDIFNLWLGYFTDFLDASVNMRYSDSVYDDRRDPYADSGFNKYSDSFVVDAQITVKPSKRVALTLSVDNLLDEDYYEYYKGPGRTFLGSVSYSF